MKPLTKRDITILRSDTRVIQVPGNTLVVYEGTGIAVNCGLNEPEFDLQPFVTVNTEDMPQAHNVGDTGIPAIAVHLNDATLYDVNQAGRDDADIIRKLRTAHEAAQGKGDQGAFDVWNVVADIIREEA